MDFYVLILVANQAPACRPEPCLGRCPVDIRDMQGAGIPAEEPLGPAYQREQLREGRFGVKFIIRNFPGRVFQAESYRFHPLAMRSCDEIPYLLARNIPDVVHRFMLDGPETLWKPRHSLFGHH